MCIISGDPVYVSNTKILVAPSEVAGRQITVYCNQVSLENESGTMILPFPESKCEFVSLDGYPTLFDDLKSVWPTPKGGSRGLSFGVGDLSSKPVQRVEVGSYTASCVSLGELEAMNEEDAKFYVVSPSTLQFVRSHYPRGFHFVLCKLHKEKTYHPFAYTHGLMEDGHLFVPTMHYHADDRPRFHKLPNFKSWNRGGEHVYGKVRNLRQHSDNSKRFGATGFSFLGVREPNDQPKPNPQEADAPDWDHVIYYINCTPDPETPASDYVFDSPTMPRLQLDKLPPMPEFKSISAVKIKDYKGNHDLVAKL